MSTPSNYDKVMLYCTGADGSAERYFFWLNNVDGTPQLQSSTQNNKQWVLKYDQSQGGYTIQIHNPNGKYLAGNADTGEVSMVSNIENASYWSFTIVKDYLPSARYISLVKGGTYNYLRGDTQKGGLSLDKLETDHKGTRWTTFEVKLPG